MSKPNDFAARANPGGETRPKDRTRHGWVRLMVVVGLILLFVVFAANALSQGAYAAGPPEVNGLFYGDDDYLTYWPYATSENGSKLYVYFDSPTLYVALVVDREVNDNVCSPLDNAAYTQNAGWDNHRSCKRLTDSEYAAFILRCTDAPNSWLWRQGYGTEVGGEWVSNATDGAGTGSPPPAFESSSSWAWNINNYVDNFPPPVPWDLYLGGDITTTAVLNWKSPFEEGNEDMVLGLDGYPITGTISYSSDYEWEWPMVYEWSTDLSICGAESVYVLAGLSHHSPIKTGGDENDKFPPNSDPMMDLGDLPDTYSTITATNGARHTIIVTNTVFMGASRDPELNGQPDSSALGDDTDGNDDEDGVVRGVQEWTNGNTVDIDITIQGIAPSADVGIWIDWDGNGTFEADEFYPFKDLTVGTVNTVQVTVPDDTTYTVGNPLSVRVRLFDDETNAPGGSLDSSDFAGMAANGEVEDYVWTFSPTAIFLKNISVGSSSGTLPMVGLALLLILAGTAIVLLRRAQRNQVDSSQ